MKANKDLIDLSQELINLKQSEESWIQENNHLGQTLEEQKV